MGATLLVPLLVTIYYGDGQIWAFTIASIFSIAVGTALFKGLKSDAEIGIREGFGIVAFGWIMFAIAGSIPFILSGALPNPIDAFFETMSGFTTTGSTVVANIEILPPSILFWRSLIQWLGGMGIIVLSLAILPFLGVGGMQLFQAEVPGPTDDRLRPRIQDTAKLLWYVYVGLTAVLFVLLLMGGMNSFESLCHALTTMATGGFSPKNASIGHYQSSYIHWVLTIFMVLAGTNFSLHYFALSGRLSAFWKSEEFRFYLLVFVGASAIVTLTIVPNYDSITIAIRDAAFQVASLVTTTGVATVDYEHWPPLALFVFLVLMTTGGSAGSTSGGVKLIRILILIKYMLIQVYQAIHPHGVRVLKIDHKPVENKVVQSVLGFIVLFGLLLMVFTVMLAAMGIDLRTAVTATLSALGNIGPGLGGVGPAQTYAHLPLAAKFVLSIAMLMGRLELITVLVLFHPDFWRR